MDATDGEQVIFDLQNAITILNEAQLAARRLDALAVPADQRGVKRGDPAVAEANRDIQHLMHLCERAYAEVAAAYWGGRGYQDPLA